MLCWRKGCWRRQEEPYLIVIRSGWKPCVAFSFWRVQLVWLVWKKHVKVNGCLCLSPCWSLARSVMQKAIQSPVDSGIPLIKPDYMPSWSTFAQWWPDTTVGCVTGWVHSSSPHKTLFEPICLYISLLPSPLPFKISFSIFMGIEESLCPRHRTSVVLTGNMLPLPPLLSSPCPANPAESHGYAATLGLLVDDVVCLLCLPWLPCHLRQGSVLTHLPLVKPVKLVPAWNCCWLLPAHSTHRGQTLHGCVLQMTLTKGKRPVSCLGCWRLFNRHKNLFSF